MNKLQNNFTTPEQSKRLLELGVPADSADMCYRINHEVARFDKIPTAIPYKDFTAKILYCPCWSVGRLIEILKECINNEDDLIDIFVELQYSNDILTTILMIFRDNKAILDFSKLEE